MQTRVYSKKTQLNIPELGLVIFFLAAVLQPYRMLKLLSFDAIRVRGAAAPA